MKPVINRKRVERLPAVPTARSWTIFRGFFALAVATFCLVNVVVERHFSDSVERLQGPRVNCSLKELEYQRTLL